MSRPLNLLLVEDSESDALLIERALRRDGLEVVCTRVDARAALEAALERQAWDAILSDYQLPGFTGFEVVHRVQARGLDCPLILVSGMLGEENAIAGLKAGAHDYVISRFGYWLYSAGNARRRRRPCGPASCGCASSPTACAT